MPGRRRPVPLTLAVVVAVVQSCAGVVAAVIGGLYATAAATSDRTATTEGSPNPWSGFGVAIGGAVGVAGLATVVLVGVPLLVLRGGSPTRRVTGRGLLVGGELLLLLPVVVFFHVRFGTLLFTGRDPLSVVFDLMLVVPLLVIAGLLAPSTGRWSMANAVAP